MKLLGQLLSWVWQRFTKPVQPTNDTLPQTQTIQSTPMNKRPLIGLICGILLGLLIRSCGNEKNPKEVVGKGNQIIVQNGGKPNTQNTTNSTGHSTRSGFLPPESKVFITPKIKGKTVDELVNIHYQKFGVARELGVQIAPIDWALGLDYKLFFIERFGFNLGFIAGNRLPVYISPTASISYRLDQIHLPNTEAWVGFVPLSNHTYQVGIRINL